MAEVVINPNDKNDTNEANLARVLADSALEDGVRTYLEQRMLRDPRTPLAVIQMDMDKSVEIRRCGIAYKLAVMKEINSFLQTFSNENCCVMSHGTRDDVTIIRTMDGDPGEALTFVNDVLKAIASTPFGKDLDKGPFFVTYSAGISYYPYNGNTAAMLLDLADGAVRLAKVNGRNSCALAQTGYHHIQSGVIDDVRWNKLLRLSCLTGLSAETLIREGYESLFQKHAALYRFCCQEAIQEETV